MPAASHYRRPPRGEKRVVIVPYSRFGQGDGAYCVGIAMGLARRGIRVTFVARGQTAAIAEHHHQRVVRDLLRATEVYLPEHASPIGTSNLESFMLLRPTSSELPPVVEAQSLQTVEALRRRFADLKPDLVIGAFHWPALLAAASLGIPRVSLIHTPNHPSGACPADTYPDRRFPTQFYASNPQVTLVNRIGARFGLPLIETMNESHDGDLVLTFGPCPQLEGAPRTLILGEPTGDEGDLRKAAKRRAPKGRGIYCYVGPAEYGRRDESGLRDAIRTLIATARRFPAYDFYLVDSAVKQWGSTVSVPSNVQLVDQCWDAARHIQEARAVIHHGGGYTGLTAYWWGVPSLVLPYNVDNHARAEGGRACGLAVPFARSLEPAEEIIVESGRDIEWSFFGHKRFSRTAGELGEALERTLDLPANGLAEAAAEFRATHRTIDDATAAIADLLERGSAAGAP